MARLITNSNTIVRIDSTAGSLKDISSFVNEIDGAGKAFDVLEFTAFADSEVQQLKGLATARSLTLRGHYGNGSSDPDVHLRGRLEDTAARTVEILPDGTRFITGEYLLVRYDYTLRNKELIGWEAEFAPSGAITLNSSS